LPHVPKVEYRVFAATCRPKDCFDLDKTSWQPEPIKELPTKMNTPKCSTALKLDYLSQIKILTLAAALIMPAATGLAQNYWQGPTNGAADYNIASNWVGNVVPTGGSANPANDNGSNSVILIQAGDPTWSINSIRAGWENNASGAYLQTGGTVTTVLKFRLAAGNNGTANNSPNSGSFGFYTLSNGVINCGNDFNVGELGTAVVNVNGGAINLTSGGNFADNNYNGAGNTGVNSVTDVVNQTAGIITITGAGQLFVGNGGPAIYNLSGGTNTVNNYIAFGRSGGYGIFNMTGGLLVQNGGGNLLVGTGYQNPSGGSPVGVLNQSGGTISCKGQFLVPENSPAVGTVNLSGTGALVVNNWIAIGRSGGNGVLNMNGGSITKIGDNSSHLDIGASANGTLNQTNGVVTNVVSDTYLGESGTGVWNLEGGSATLGLLELCVNGSGTGTLNLDGGVLQVTGIDSGSPGVGLSTLTFNGGTLQAGADNPAFLHDIALVNVSAGGAVFDSQNYNITVSQALPNNGDGSGGLTKLGAGTLTLTGANSYSGDTVVSNGTLNVQTTSSANGNYTVADGAALGVTVESLNAQLGMASLTIGSATGAALNFDLGNFGDPSSSGAPMNVSGTFTKNGTTTVNIADAMPQVGEFPLVHYGSLAGSGNLVLGSLPSGMVAAIVTNAGNNSIDLNVTSVNQPRWDGRSGGTWDLGADTNWVNIGTGLPTTYNDGSPVVFNDSALGTTNVNLTATVQPSSVTVNDSSLNYNFTGSGSISGSTGLSKSGSGTLSIGTINGYTGPTVISGGTLSVANLANGGSASAIGASSSDPTNLVLSDGTLSYTGPVVSINRGYSLQNTNDAIDTESNLTLSGTVTAVSTADFIKTGPAQLTYATVGNNTLSGSSSLGYRTIQGTTVFDGSSGPQTNTVQGHFGVGGLGGTNAAVILTNTTLNVPSGGVDLGRSGGAVGTLSVNSGAVLNTTAGNFALGDGGGVVSTGVVNQAGGTVNVTGPQMFVGQNIAGVGSYNLSGGTLNINNWLAVGRQGGTGTFTLSGSGVLNKTGGGNLDIGTSAGVGGFAGSGTLNQTGGAITNTASQTWLGEGSSGEPASGTWNMTDGTALLGELHVGVGGIGTNTVNISGPATITCEGFMGLALNNTNVIGIVNIGNASQPGGAITVSNDMTVGDQGTGVLNMVTNGGGRLTVTGTLYLSRSSSNAFGSVNLNTNSTIVTGYVNNGYGFTYHLTNNPNAFNFNGGTLKAYVGSPYFIQPYVNAVVKGGGAIIDDGGYSIEVLAALVDGGGGGGLTKRGSGTLQLDGVNTYTGSTLVSAGTLAGTGSIAGPVTVASGATLAAGDGPVGTFTINNALTFSAGSTAFMKITPTNHDEIAGLTSVSYDGSLVVTNISGTTLTPGSTFQLFSSATAGSGNFGSVTILPAGSGTFDPSTGKLTITSTGRVIFNPVTVSAGNLILTGNGGAAPGSGYTLLTTTNVATPLANWTTNATGTLDGSGMFSNSIPINTSEPARFFDVRTP
jgi:autotransporter-associated beta strand protein